MKALVCLIASLVLVGSASANLLSNPGFESGDFTDWNAGSYYISGGDMHSGSFGASFASEGVIGENYYIMEQLVAVTAGAEYDASCWGRFVGTANNAEQFFEVQWVDASGTPMWGDSVGTTPVSGPEAYTQYALNDIVAPVGAVTASVRAVVHTTDSTTGQAWHSYDDFSFAASVPEPTTIAFLGLGLLGVFYMRRGSSLR